jgi:diguanylate cyclase (GGDEF)-like protein
MSQFADKPHMRLRFWIGLTAVLLLAAGSVAAALFVYTDDQDDLDRREAGFAARAARQAESAVNVSSGQLASGAAFFQAKGELSRREFDLVGRSLLRRGVLTGTAYVPRVTAAERAAYERRNGFEITERGPDGLLRRAARRPVYFPLTYAEADRDPTAVLGFDLGSDPDRFPYLLRARDTGTTIATPITRLVLGGAGVNVFHAIYRDAEIPASEPERRRQLVGFVAGSIEVAELAGTAVAVLPGDVERQLVVDGQTVVGDPLVLDESARAEIGVADRTWVLIVRDPTSPDLSLPLVLAAIGVSLATLLAALILTWSRNERIAQLQREASEDPLTGLKNRRRFEEELRAAMARGRRDRTTGAMLMLDIDNFKHVNDTYGHPAGDQLINEVADVLRRRTRESDVLARLGGDEFAVVLPHCSRTEAVLVAEAIAEAIRRHVPEQDGVEPVTASVGVAMFGEDPRISAASIVSEADTAMYAAKDGGRDGFRVFDTAAVGEEQVPE